MENKTAAVPRSVEVLGGRIEKVRGDLETTLVAESRQRKDHGNNLSKELAEVTKRRREQQATARDDGRWKPQEIICGAWHKKLPRNIIIEV